MSSIIIRKLSAHDPDLKQSKLLDAIYKSAAYALEHDGIGLTKMGAFDRKFCHWAAENFSWKEYSEEYLLRFQKVLNEDDVMPVLVLHHLFFAMKLGRNIKGKFKFSRKSQKRLEDKTAFFNELSNFYLFRFNHLGYQRRPFIAPGNWDIFLNVINVEAHREGISEADLVETLYGIRKDDPDRMAYFDYSSFLLWSVLNPLHWLGYLEAVENGNQPFERVRIYFKSPLWRKCFRLDTDQDLRPDIFHKAAFR